MEREILKKIIWRHFVLNLEISRKKFIHKKVVGKP